MAIIAINAKAQYSIATNGGTITITGYNGPGGTVAIPAVINGLDVTAIGPRAFGFNASITNVTIPDSVVDIGTGAFTDCTRLAAVTIGNKVVTIGDTAFFNCSSLRSAGIPQSVKSIGIQSFLNCIALNSISIPTGVTSLGKESFSFCLSLSSIAIPSSVTNIGDFAFGSCKNLSAITVDQFNPAYSSLAGVLFDKSQSTLIQCPGGKMGTYAVPNGVVTVAGSSFRKCDNLTTISIPNSVTNIGDSAFSLCFNLTAITVDALNPFYSSVAGVLFNKSQTILLQCPSAIAGSFSIPAGVTALGRTAFIGCRNLTAITTDPQNQAFSSIDGVLFDKMQTTLLQFPEARTGSYTIPANVVRLADFSFVSCTGVTDVIIADSVKDIGVEAFGGCSALAGITIPNSVSNISIEAFEGCTKLTQVSLGSGLTAIGSYVFYQCPSLTNVALPDTIKSVADRAFQFCTGLKTVTIGNGVTNIGALAFGFCPNLASIFCRGDAPAANPSAFANDVATVYFLGGTTGWGSQLAGLPTHLWNPLIQTQAPPFGFKQDGFGFDFTGPTNFVVVVETCTNLAQSMWIPLQTNVLVGGGMFFNDPATSSGTVRFYRIRLP